MEIQAVERNGVVIAVVTSSDVVLHSTASALDLMASVRYGHDCDRIAISKEAVAEEFFRLASGLAGEILQKYVNYRLKLAIYGDFSHYTSKPLQDFIRESNRGSQVFFTASVEEAIDRLANVC